MIEGSSKSDSEKNSEIDSLESNPFHWRIFMRTPSWKPPTDVYETETMIYVRVEVAGMSEEDFAIELNGREMLVRGFRQDTAERRAFHQMEIRFGEFILALEMPSQINPDQVQAVYDNGFLVISLLKAKPRQISISE